MVRHTAHLIGLLLVLTLAGCNAPSNPNTQLDDSLLADVIEQAMAAGVSEAQLGVLESARDSGEFSYEQLVELTESAIECMTDAGVNAFRVQDTVVAGDVTVPEFGAREGPGQSEEVALEIMGRCYSHEVGFARMYWISQPRSQQQIEGALELVKDDVTKCLVARGYPAEELTEISGLVDALNRDIDERGGDAGFVPCYEGVLPGS